MTTTTQFSTNGAVESAGAAVRNMFEGRGPSIWLAGDPEDLKNMLPLGARGIVTNTIVLNDMVKKYGQVTDVVQRYLDITDKQVVVEIDGHTTQELLDAGEVFTKMSDQVVLKIPTTLHGLGAFRALFPGRRRHHVHHRLHTDAGGCRGAGPARHTSCRSANPYRDVGGDPTKLVRECKAMFGDWAQRPYITAALVRVCRHGVQGDARRRRRDHHFLAGVRRDDAEPVNRSVEQDVPRQLETRCMTPV